MRSRRWMVGIGAIGLVAGLLLGLWISNVTMGSALRLSAQNNLMSGWALIRQGNDALRVGDKAGALDATTMGTTYLFAAAPDVNAAGISGEGITATYMQHAEWELVQGKATPGELRVIRTFLSSLEPFSHQNIGNFSMSAIAKALQRVDSAISKASE